MIPRTFSKIAKRRRQKKAVRAFRHFSIQPGDVVIDGGANYGRVTLRLIGTGARIEAYEPNPAAFEHLSKAFGQHPQVNCIRKGLSDHNGTAKLYLHHRSEQDSLHYSEASSLIRDKWNISRDNAVEIELVDIADVVNAIDDQIRLLKLDIEGGEYTVLDRLLDTGLIHRIDQVFCETHELKIPSLRNETAKLRQRLARENITHVNLDWV